MKQLSILVSSGWLVWRRLGLHGLTLLALVWLAPGLEVAASGTPSPCRSIPRTATSGPCRMVSPP